LVQLQ